MKPCATIATAYDYFIRFSPAASELDSMVELMYNQLSGLPLEQQQRMIRDLSAWVERLPQPIASSENL